ncbi:hypothetical protein BDN67DRAFT_970229 [Paxillus ammoniavirescens]|nr:hypothetical protein BDN67DRAFT_970229 [Paxillus ammoniavirescens]
MDQFQQVDSRSGQPPNFKASHTKGVSSSAGIHAKKTNDTENEKIVGLGGDSESAAAISTLSVSMASSESLKDSNTFSFVLPSQMSE